MLIKSIFKSTLMFSFAEPYLNIKNNVMLFKSMYLCELS